MPIDKGGIYQRGGFWLDHARGAGGKLASSNWYINWYDSSRGRQCRESTRTADVRAACDALDAHYLASLRPTDADRAAYCVSTALTDYYLEHGRHQSSAEAIRARLGHLSRFIDREIEARRLTDPFMPEHVDDGFLTRFRTWSLADPIVARRKDAGGDWIDGKSRPRAASTVEESVIQLKAALNHAYNKRRIAYMPPFKHKTRAEVTPARHDRVTVPQIAEMLDYTLRGAGKYAGHGARLLPLRRYLIAAVTTLARPDAILDMSVSAERGQWLKDDRRFALNPGGRVQTKKHRPVVPVPDVLHGWLCATDEWFVCREITRFDPDQQIDIVEQLRVCAIRSAWDTMRTTLKLPASWGPKLLRHSMASELRKRQVDPWELSGQLGHRVLRTSEVYAAYDPSYLGTVQAGIADVLADLTRAAGAAIHPKLTQAHGNVAVLRA